MKGKENFMKKTSLLLLLLIFCLSLCSCGEKDPMENEELVDTLGDAAKNHDNYVRWMLELRLTTPHDLEFIYASIKGIEEVESNDDITEYKVSGVYVILYRDIPKEEVPFSAVMTVNSLNEATCVSLDIEDSI